MSDLLLVISCCTQLSLKLQPAMLRLCQLGLQILHLQKIKSKIQLFSSPTLKKLFCLLSCRMFYVFSELM